MKVLSGLNLEEIEKLQMNLAHQNLEQDKFTIGFI